MENNKRVLKRIVIIIIYLLILSLVVGLFYSIFRIKETCVDGIKNQNEEEVDCGGVCSSCKKLEYENLNVLKAGLAESGREGMVDVYAQIENPNAHLGVSKVEYTFVTLDNQGEKSNLYSGTSFLLPQEKKFILANNLTVDKNQVKSIELKIDSVNWVKFEDSFENPQFKIINKNLNLDFSGSSVSGVLINDSAYDFSVIKIKIILKDESGKVRYTNFTEMRTIKSQEEREFKAIWPGFLSDDITKVEVEAEVNVFDPQSFFKQYYEPQKFQEITSSRL